MNRSESEQSIYKHDDSNTGLARSLFPAYIRIPGLWSFYSLLSKSSRNTFISMLEKQRLLEGDQSDVVLSLTQRSSVQVTNMPTAAIQTFQAEPRVIKLHKAGASAIQSKQSIRRDLALHFNRVDWALLRTLKQPKTRMRGAWQQATQPSYNLDKNLATGGPERNLNVLNNPL
jgi:hypothetical protein